MIKEKVKQGNRTGDQVVLIHKVFVQYSGIEEQDHILFLIIEQAILETLTIEKVDILCVINVLITDDKGIKEYNREYRDIDKATDVLSFPMQTFKKAGWKGLTEPELDEDTGDLPLGDIVISLESSERQADEYGNKAAYELAYLTIHSTLHLLGYDHDNEINEKAMHKKNKRIIKEMSFGVND